MRPPSLRQTRPRIGATLVKVLGLDTACGACSAAIWSDDAIVARRFEQRARGHAEALMPMVQAVMDDSVIDYDALDAIAVTRGPGTFTGLRIGLAAARGLALATGRPLIGRTTLEVIAAEAAKEHPGVPILAAIDARRGQVYAQSFRSDLSSDSEPRALTLDAAANLVPNGRVIYAGDMARELNTVRPAPGVIASGSGQPDAAVLARLVASLPLPRSSDPVSPLYLRAPDAILPEQASKRAADP